jgi:hypothetical protein
VGRLGNIAHTDSAVAVHGRAGPPGAACRVRPRGEQGHGALLQQHQQGHAGANGPGHLDGPATPAQPLAGACLIASLAPSVLDRSQGSSLGRRPAHCKHSTSARYNPLQDAWSRLVPETVRGQKPRPRFPGAKMLRRVARAACGWCVWYSDEKVANRDIRVWHGATDNGP